MVRGAVSTESFARSAVSRGTRITLGPSLNQKKRQAGSVPSLR
jgi:hypothetical protein